MSYDSLTRTVDWLSYQTRQSLAELDVVYIDARNEGTAIDFTSEKTLAVASVPEGAESVQAVVDAVFHISWTGGDYLDAVARVEANTSVVATAWCYLNSSAGSYNCTLLGVHEPREPTIYKLVLEAQAGRTSGTIDNVALRVQHRMVHETDRLLYSTCAVSSVQAWGLTGATSAFAQLLVDGIFGTTKITKLTDAAPEFTQLTVSSEFTEPMASGDYYVSTAGSDTDPGTKAQPFQTIQKGLDTVSSGQTVVVMAGDYPEQLEFKTASVTLIAGTSPVNVASPSSPQVYVTAEAFDYGVIDGINVTGTPAIGIYVENADFWEVKNCTIKNMSNPTGTYVWGCHFKYGSNHQVNNCHFDNIFNAYESYGLYFRSNASCTAWGNMFTCIQKNGIRIRDVKNSSINDNWFAGVYEPIAVNLRCTNNSIFNNDGHHNESFIAYKHSPSPGATQYNEIRYNTMRDLITDCVRLGVNGSACDYLRVHHNLFKHGGDNMVYEDSEWTGSHMSCDYNMYWSTAGRPDGWYYFDSYGVTTCASVAEIVTQTDYEDNGLEYDSDEVDNYGATSISLSYPDWTPITSLSIVGASRSTADAAVCVDWQRTQTGGSVDRWESGANSADEWLSLDLGEVSTWDTFIYKPYFANNAAEIRIHTSDDDASYTSIYSLTTTCDNYTFFCLRMPSAQSCRYVRIEFETALTATGFTVEELSVGSLV